MGNWKSHYIETICHNFSDCLCTAGVSLSLYTNIKEQNTNHSKSPTAYSRSQAANKKERVALRRPISQKTFKEHFFFPREALESNSTLKPTPLQHSQHPHQAPPAVGQAHLSSCRTTTTKDTRLCYRSTKASLLLRIISAF